MERVAEHLAGRREACGRNPVNHLALSSTDVPAKLRSRKSLWREIAQDGVLLIGQPLESL